jgi:hypothetical protein
MQSFSVLKQVIQIVTTELYIVNVISLAAFEDCLAIRVYCSKPALSYNPPAPQTKTTKTYVRLCVTFRHFKHRPV